MTKLDPDTIGKEGNQTFQVTLVPSEKGSYTLYPQLPTDGRVSAGTELTIAAYPEAGYRLDAIYCTLKGGMWGTTSTEYFIPKVTISVDDDLLLGATFIETSLVAHLLVTQDVIYARPGKKPLKYDVYSPIGARELPAIIIVHGGGWSSNNEDIMRGLARELTKGGNYVVFSIDYRWINTLDGDETPNSMHQLIEDVFGAIAHIQTHAAAYGADPGRIALTGDSAGGHLSEAAAVFSPSIGTAGFGEKEGIYEFKPVYVPHGKSLEQVKQELTAAIKAVAPSYGPSDAADFKNFLRQTDAAYWDAVSPIRHVPKAEKRKLPHFIVRGANDSLITERMVQQYVTELQAKGQEVSYLEVPGAGHAFFDWKPDAQTRETFTRYGVPYAAKMKAFFDAIFY
ncbi:Acetyl esterase/lipase [Cyclobacterium xiamenense]|uniref:Acetyl esterase/lipase n=1 Tax=Cyclobacterium xiamenense TaxID=1297121 RepID=A0A1H6UBT3_9BACT|nr:alpha/beta hydrolase [Cyclobacterium xiamenense]SEI89036.1 Acetyl esterase/lipase [Cyclobacterium xiamenense]